MDNSYFKNFNLYEKYFEKYNLDKNNIKKDDIDKNLRNYNGKIQLKVKKYSFKLVKIKILAFRFLMNYYLRIV